MLIKRPDEISASEITEEALYWDRRRFLGAAASSGLALAAAAATPGLLLGCDTAANGSQRSVSNQGDEELTPYESVTTYNNFYEFGTGKEDPARNAHTLRPRPWTIAVEGEVHKTRVFDIDAILKQFPAEERVYRLRCVEAWSMVIPWLGFPLKDLLAVVEPTTKARFVEFTTLYDPEQMPGQKREVLPWPYVEGLRLDEAMHPLTILSVGLYGKMLPNQNGAPVRLVVLWKYGFKSIKSIVRIRLVEDQPSTTWNVTIPREYGFYANVNPEVDHPRWSQARERRIGKFFKQDTPMFNGYAAQVAHLYGGMDLRRYY